MNANPAGIAKAAALERYLARVAEEYEDDPDNLRDQRRQDALILNVLRACETSIDLAMLEIARRRLGTPQSSRDAFQMLRDAGVLEADLAEALGKMVGFRNLAVHEYQRIDLAVLQAIVEQRLEDFRRLLKALHLRGPEPA